jgi:hypothetical protein
LIYSPKLKLLLFNIISLVCDTLVPVVRKLADAAQEEVLVASVATPEHPVSLSAHTATTVIVPLAAMYSCVHPSINAGSIGHTLSSIEGVV